MANDRKTPSLGAANRPRLPANGKSNAFERKEKSAGEKVRMPIDNQIFVITNVLSLRVSHLVVD